ncbi:MAG TPA: hypothetical protein VGL61_01595 [Kofleriaceae bacterium]|jgi:hypothetical protein
MSSRNTRLTLHCSIVLALAACSSDNTATPCTMDDECPSRFCQADDTCAPLQTVDASTGGDSSTQMDAPGSTACIPNNDGMISLAELPLAAGRSANFLIAAGSGIDWDTTGSAAADNSRTWDLSGALAGDGEQPVMLASPSGAWWAGDFPTATYATILSKTEPTLLGVFNVGSSGVTLLGVVSTSAGATKTELSYSPPAQILAVPFMASSSWTSTSTVTGYADGIAAEYSEEYDSIVDQVGTMKTPYGTFPVLRVATNLSRDSVLYNRTFAWVAECFGSVAQVQSQSYPDAPTTTEFSNPAEVWRITP